jgi:Holliday junction resolvase RusA-like endonuclease
MDKASVKPIIFEVPFTPPSVNHYKKPVTLRTRNGPVKSFARTPEADRFLQAVAIFARGQSLPPATAAERLKVRYALTCTVFLGEGERGDGDNFFKCIADGLTGAGVIHSDARIRTWHIDVEDGDRQNPRTLICVSFAEKGWTRAESMHEDSLAKEI